MYYVKAIVAWSALVTVNVSLSISLQEQKGIQNRGMLQIGEANGKTFITDSDVERLTSKFSGEFMVWADANQYCSDLGWQWAKIVTAEESELISNYAKVYGWQMHLSATDGMEEGVWLWAQDNSPLTLTNWFAGRPTNDTNKNYAFVNYGSGQWYDSGGGYAHPLCFTYL